MTDVTLKDLQENFKHLNLIGQAIVTAMMIWESTTNKECPISHETKAALMLHHFKLVELATTWETLTNVGKVIDNYNNQQFHAHLNLRLDDILNEMKDIASSIDLLESEHVSTH